MPETGAMAEGWPIRLLHRRGSAVMERPAPTSYHSDGYCTKRFSPYDSLDVNHVYFNLSPDSMEWIKGRVDTSGTDATDLLMYSTTVYMIGFDVRVMPEDTAPITRLNYLHPMVSLPMDATLDTVRWRWLRPFIDPDTLQDAIFTWWGKRGTDSIDAVLGHGRHFLEMRGGRRFDRRLHIRPLARCRRL